MSLDKKITDQLQEKYQKLNQDLDIHLEGLLYSKPINYWDYIQTAPLLSLQAQRTNLPDEKVFIMYHQINELLFKMVLWEMQSGTVGHTKWYCGKYRVVLWEIQGGTVGNAQWYCRK